MKKEMLLFLRNHPDIIEDDLNTGKVFYFKDEVLLLGVRGVHLFDVCTERPELLTLEELINFIKNYQK
jgi:hypothetical protein